MTEPEHYREYSWLQAIALFGSVSQAQLLCSGQWVMMADHILCFAVVGEPHTASYFLGASRFCWVANQSFDTGPGSNHEVPLPGDVNAGRYRNRPIFLFARSSGQEQFLYLGQLEPTYPWGGGVPGKYRGRDD